MRGRWVTAPMCIWPARLCSNVWKCKNKTKQKRSTRLHSDVFQSVFFYFNLCCLFYFCLKLKPVKCQWKDCWHLWHGDTISTFDDYEDFQRAGFLSDGVPHCIRMVLKYLISISRILRYNSTVNVQDLQRYRKTEKTHAHNGLVWFCISRWCWVLWQLQLFAQTLKFISILQPSSLGPRSLNYFNSLPPTFCPVSKPFLILSWIYFSFGALIFIPYLE